MLPFLWRANRGYWLNPGDNPYLRWRVETYWGIPASEMTSSELRRFLWQHRRELLRFLRWARRMRALPRNARDR
jgi:hypothetical protein